MDYDQIIERTRDLAGFSRPEEAERALAAVTGALGQRLLDDEARALGAELPAPLAQILRRDGYAGDFDVVDFYDRVGRREGVEIGFAREHAQVVCRVVGEAISPSARLRLQKHLPSFADLFEPRPAPEPPLVHHHAPLHEPPTRDTLATGRPGSKHPVSEARPERAHSHSVARSDDPHADTKLSSSRGLTQERLDETLATGQPGPSRPVGDAR